MLKTDFNNNVFKKTVFSFSLSLLFAAVLTLIFSFLISVNLLPLSSVTFVSPFIIAVTCFLTALFYLIKTGKNGLITGALLGAIIVLIFTVICAVAELKIPSVSFLIKLLIGAVSGGLGGIIGVGKA